MPELPEVETIRIGLSKLLPKLVVKDVWHDWPKSFPNAPADVARFLVGAKIERIKRRAKVLIIELSSNYSLVIHLKMTGQLVFVPKAQKQVTGYRLQVIEKNKRFGAGHPSKSLVGKLPDKSTRVILHFNNGAKLFFNDQRKFGWMRLLPTAEVPLIDFMQTVGPEPLEDDFTVDKFIERLMTRQKSPIKAVLLDQKVLAGVGNIYADESLWLAKIHPSSVVAKIPKTRLVVLHQALRDVLNQSIENGGSTDRNYVNAKGERGSYLEFAQVFRKAGKPCPRCGTEIIKIRVAGRGTHICSREQKERK
ncbi:MAG TPA: bifunctional DNA-formamidopyrimidine glycosylase/DNA-(apurinic or apyrimidinic site) lyase [Candidatus Saccharimonadales bacterium]|nr:bifunctional DNA-formamidopyrimidine glycosylase/DNA-(apurinic or apyrimidinic site) lyase [Candidatus Saccharimonadales bacterium]